MDGRVFIAQGLTKACASGDIEAHALSGLDLGVAAGEAVVMPGSSGGAKRPDILLCDESTGALVSQTGIRVIDVLLTVSSQPGTTTLIVTHNAVIQDVADRVFSSADGQISGVRQDAKRQAAAELAR